MRLWLSGPRILGLRPGISFRPDELLQKSAPSIRSSQGGFVYVISGDHGHLKIGSSENPTRRLAELRTGSSFQLAIAYAGALRCDGRAIEAAAHETLSRYRLEGEWFNCPVDMAVAAISAAAHRLDEPIASVPPTRISDVVRIAALSNRNDLNVKDNLFSRIIMLMLKWLFYLAIALATSIITIILFIIIKTILAGQEPQ